MQSSSATGLTPTLANTSSFFTSGASSPSRPTTRDGPSPSGAGGGSGIGSFFGGSSQSQPQPPGQSQAKDKERKSSFSRRSSLSSSRRRGSTSTPSSSNAVITDAAAPPALPDYALSAAVKIVPQKDSRDGVRSPVSPETVPATTTSSLSRTSSNNAGNMQPLTPSVMPGISPTQWHQSESAMIHQQIVEAAHKRISTLAYMRKAHEGRVYWFNTYLFDKNDLGRMPSYDPRKLARKATNILLLGLSIPTINDLYSSTPVEFLRSLNSLFSEFDSFQQLHGESGSSLSRARLPNMFRRPGGKSRRSTLTADMGYGADDAQGGLPSAGAGNTTPSVMNFAANESDLLPGEEYTYLLTPSLPFDPDFFETFATLCDVLIDCYNRFLALVPTPRECSAPVAELFAKADSKLRKLIIQGTVKEFEDHSKTHVKSEVASIGKVVLSGLM